MRKLIFKKRHSIILIITSFQYGYKILANPLLYQTLEAYKTLNFALNYASLGWLFLVGSLLKTIGIIFNYVPLKIASLGLLGGLWFVVFLGLAIQDSQGSPNAGYIFTGYIFLSVICIAVEEVFK